MTDRLQDHPLASADSGERLLLSLQAESLVAAPQGEHAPGQNGRAASERVGASDDVRDAIESGKAGLARGEFDLADAELTRAIRLAPHQPEAFLLRGQVCEQQGDDGRALDDYSTALQLDVSQLLTFAQRLLALAAKRDFASAVEEADLSLLVNQRICRACFLRGALLIRRKDWARAIADYNQILQLDPANSLAFLRRGDANSQIGEWGRAAADYSESLRLEPNCNEAYNNRGEALLRLGLIDQALADFTAALRLDSLYVPARINRADAYLQRGEYDLAVTDYNQAIHVAPGKARPYAGRALARVQKGEWERALADLNKAISLDPATAHAPESQKTADRLRTAYEQALAGLNQFKRLFRQAAEAIGAVRPNQRADESQSPGRHEPAADQQPATSEPHQAAAPILQTAPVAAPSSSIAGPSGSQSDRDAVALEEDPLDRPRRLAARHCRRGHAFQQEGDQERALTSYTSALAVDPTCVEAYRERGLIRRLAGCLEEAIQDFDTAIELEPGAELYFRRGVAHAEKREFPRAFADFDEAIERDSNHALAFLNRGLISVVVGKFEEAARDAERAIEIDPALTRARLLRGVAHGKLGRHEQAVDDFDAVLVQEPENARAHNHRGLAFAAEGKYAEALAAYEEAIRHSPKLWAAHFNRGIAYHLSGDYQEAVSAFTRFLERRPQFAPAFLHRGLAHQARHEYDDAIADFRQAIQLDPNLTEAYTSCLEATRLKYESAIAPKEAAPDRSAERSQAGAAPGAALAETAAIGPERTVHDQPRMLAPPSAKLQLECPECGAAGLLDVRHLGKKFRCPGCHLWWRTNAAGNLEEATRPTEDANAEGSETKSGVWNAQSKPPIDRPAADVGAKSGVWKAPAAESERTSEAQHAASAAEALLAAPTPVKSSRDEDGPAQPPRKAKGDAKGKPKVVLRRSHNRGLRYAALWLKAFAQTRSGRWTLAAGILLLLASTPLLFPSLFPSELKSRGQKAAQAWLARDAEQLKAFTDPANVESLPRWLETAPPPEINAEKGKPVVTVSVARNDGDSAEMLIQVKAAKSDGAPAYYVFRHRWVLRKGAWYLKPDMAPAGLGVMGAGAGTGGAGTRGN